MPRCYSGSLSDLIASLLRKHPGERPDIDQILKIPFIKIRLEHPESIEKSLGRAHMKITGIPTRIEAEVGSPALSYKPRYLRRHPCVDKEQAQIERSNMLESIRPCSPFKNIPLPPDINAQFDRLDRMFLDKKSHGASNKKSSPAGIDYSRFRRPVTSKNHPIQNHTKVPGTSKKSVVLSKETNRDSERYIECSRDKVIEAESRRKYLLNIDENDGRESRGVTAAKNLQMV